VPFAALRSKSSSITRAPVAVSRFPVGSSANRTAGPRDEGARDGDALLLAARELPRVVAEPRREAHVAEHGARPRRAHRAARKLEREHHVLERA
jgi:hypothetical protein